MRLTVFKETTIINKLYCNMQLILICEAAKLGILQFIKDL